METIQPVVSVVEVAAKNPSATVAGGKAILNGLKSTAVWAGTAIGTGVVMGSGAALVIIGAGAGFAAVMGTKNWVEKKMDERQAKKEKNKADGSKNDVAGLTPSPA